jgi:HSP20 family protein
MGTGLVRWNPWNDLFSLQNQMEQLFNGAFGGVDNTGRTGVANLAIDIRQADDAYIIDASVPGFSPEDIEVTLDNSLLTIAGKMSTQSENSQGGYLHRERRMTSVFRQVSLPAEVRADDISADFKNGVLTIRVPRVKKTEPKRITVQNTDTKASQVVEAN